MPTQIRGADIVARTLDAAGLTTIFTLSGNHIMPLFDAAIGTAPAADPHAPRGRRRAHGGRLGPADGRSAASRWSAAAPGFTNAAAALCTAQAAESPLVLLSGHAALERVGRGAFQELRQADMAAPVTKASWTARVGGDAGRGRRRGRAHRACPAGRGRCI